MRSISFAKPHMLTPFAHRDPSPSSRLSWTSAPGLPFCRSLLSRPVPARYVQRCPPPAFPASRLPGPSSPPPFPACVLTTPRPNCVPSTLSKVYAVEASDMAVMARKLVAANGLSDRITVIQAKVEEVRRRAWGKINRIREFTNATASVVMLIPPAGPDARPTSQSRSTPSSPSPSASCW